MLRPPGLPSQIVRPAAPVYSIWGRPARGLSVGQGPTPPGGLSPPWRRGLGTAAVGPAAMVSKTGGGMGGCPAAVISPPGGRILGNRRAAVNRQRRSRPPRTGRPRHRIEGFQRRERAGGRRVPVTRILYRCMELCQRRSGRVAMAGVGGKSKGMERVYRNNLIGPASAAAANLRAGWSASSRATPRYAAGFNSRGRALRWARGPPRGCRARRRTSRGG